MKHLFLVLSLLLLTMGCTSTTTDSTPANSGAVPASGEQTQATSTATNSAKSTWSGENPFKNTQIEGCLTETLSGGAQRLNQLIENTAPTQDDLDALNACQSNNSNRTDRVSWSGGNPFHDETIEVCIIEGLPNGMERLTELRDDLAPSADELDLLNACQSNNSNRTDRVNWSGGNPFHDETIKVCIIEGLPNGMERLTELRDDLAPSVDELDLLNACNALVARQSGQSNWSDDNPFADPNLAKCLLDTLDGGTVRLEELQGNSRPTSVEIQALNNCIGDLAGTTGESASAGTGETGESASAGTGETGGSASAGPSTTVKINHGIPVSTNQLTLEDSQKTASRANFPQESLAALCAGDSESAHVYEENNTFYRLLRSLEVWDVGCTGKGTVIVVIDSTDSSHPDFADRVILELCIGVEGESDPCSNGEMFEEGVGAAAGDSDHGTSVTGAVNHFAPEASFILIKPAGSTKNGVGNTSGAYEWIVSNATKYGIDAAVMSFGSGQSERELHRAGLDDKCPNDHPSSPTFAQMKNLGVMPIFASGNDGRLSMLGFPACLNSTVSVGATDEYGNVATYSNSHEDLTILAPSGFRMPVGYDAGYDSLEGTSFAAPVYAALVAIGRQIRPDITVDELIQASRYAARSVDDVKVPDLRLIDFLGFAQHLVGQTIPPRETILYAIDATYNIYVGQTLEAHYLADKLTSQSSDVESLTSFEVIDLFGPQCRLSLNKIRSYAPGECILKLTIQPLTDEGQKIGSPEIKLVRIRSSEARASDIHGEIRLQKHQSVMANDIANQFDLQLAGAYIIKVDILDGESEVCSWSERQSKLITLASGTCTVLITNISVDSAGTQDQSILVTIKVD